MMSGRSMYKTKLCILYTKRGHCTRQNCSFAHGNAELRRPGSSAFTGRRNNQDNDLRDKLDRRFSLERRHSSGRNGRGDNTYKPFEKRRDRDYRDNRKLDEQSDYAGGSNVGNRTEDGSEDRRNKFAGYNNVLGEQLKEVQLDIKTLNNDKLRIGACLKEKVQEAEILTSRIQELEVQLEREKEESRRISSSIKKFVKEHNRFCRAQDDLKRSQARLQKLGNQLSAYLTGSEGNDREADIDIVSDEENPGHRSKTAWDTQIELQNTSSLTRKRHYVGQDAIQEPFEDVVLRGDGEDKLETLRLKKSSCWNLDPSASNSEKETVLANGEDGIPEPSTKEDKRKRRRVSSSTLTVDKAKGSGSVLVMPSTSMAAHADDEVTEIEEEKLELVKTVSTDGGATSDPKGSPFSVPPPPPVLRNTHSQSQSERDDNDVDAGRTEEAGNVGAV